MKRYLSEFIGTYALVLTGTGAIVMDDVSGGAITHVGIAISFGLVVMAMIYAVGDISGAHLNPAVTVGFFAARRLPLGEIPGYLLGQTFGALTASGFLAWMFPDHPPWGDPSFPAPLESLLL